MAPKKKTITAIGSSGAERPVPVRTSSGPVADRTRAAAREHQHRSGSQSLASGVVRAPDDGPRIAKSKDGAGPPRRRRGALQECRCATCNTPKILLGFINFLFMGRRLFKVKKKLLLLKTFKASILCVFLNMYFGLEGFSFSVDSTQIFSLGKFLKSFLLKITL